LAVYCSAHIRAISRTARSLCPSARSPHTNPLGPIYSRSSDVIWREFPPEVATSVTRLPEAHRQGQVTENPVLPEERFDLFSSTQRAVRCQHQVSATHSIVPAVLDQSAVGSAIWSTINSSTIPVPFLSRSPSCFSNAAVKLGPPTSLVDPSPDGPFRSARKSSVRSQ
jgi:hypothetical protein